MDVIYVLWLREVKRYLRSRSQIVVSLAQPVMYLVALGFGFGSVFARAGAGNYLQFMAPGIVAMSVLFSAIFSGIAMLWDRQFGFLKETLVAPVPRLAVMLGRTLGGATTAMIQGALILIVCMVTGFRVQHWEFMLVTICFVALIAIAFAALGTAIGSMSSNMQVFQMLMNFLIMPLFFLSGALYPLTGLPRLLAVMTQLNPLTYGVDGLRGSMVGVWHFNCALDMLVLGITAGVFLVLGAWKFSRIEI